MNVTITVLIFMCILLSACTRGGQSADDINSNVEAQLREANAISRALGMLRITNPQGFTDADMPTDRAGVDILRKSQAIEKLMFEGSDFVQALQQLNAMTESYGAHRFFWIGEQKATARILQRVLLQQDNAQQELAAECVTRLLRWNYSDVPLLYKGILFAKLSETNQRSSLKKLRTISEKILLNNQEEPVGQQSKNFSNSKEKYIAETAEIARILPE